ncbi:MAG: hypothetical protein MUF54_10105, partial [Polyangiaceae bacterium]|nr:hypothetical protein [Polyangiaceae bacterium]
IDDLDVSVETGYARVYDATDHECTDGHGHADDAFGIRYRFLGTGAIDVAVATGWTLPTGDRGAPDRLGMSQGYFSWDGTLVASWDAGRATGGFELGGAVPLGADREDADGVVLGNVAAGYHVLDWLQPEVELNYERHVSVGPDPEVLAVTMGVVAPWGEGNRVTAGVQQAIWGRHASAFTGVSIAYKAAF